ncbi:MAG: DNA repair protein RecO [Bacteroidetes bacterium]|nr:DNA repair protein RecO [Bacteroidota bacterium]
MLHKTRGIVLHTTDYSETSIVAKIYTELFGLQSYIVNSVRKKNAKIKSNVFQPFTLVDLVVYHKERGGLQRVAEAKPNPALRNIPFDIRKSSMTLFLDEVLYKSIREEECNTSLFEFIFHAVQLLDLQNPPNADFHLLFLLQYSKYLGFFPIADYDSTKCVFNLQEGHFQSDLPSHPFYIPAHASLYFFQLLQALPDFNAKLSIPVEIKRQLIESILEYFELHLTGFKGIKSHRVLEQVWGD